MERTDLAFMTFSAHRGLGRLFLSLGALIDISNGDLVEARILPAEQPAIEALRHRPSRGIC
jgi:hypothetical protein